MRRAILQNSVIEVNQSALLAPHGDWNRPLTG